MSLKSVQKNGEILFDLKRAVLRLEASHLAVAQQLEDPSTTWNTGYENLDNYEAARALVDKLVHQVFRAGDLVDVKDRRLVEYLQEEQVRAGAPADEEEDEDEETEKKDPEKKEG